MESIAVASGMALPGPWQGGLRAEGLVGWMERPGPQTDRPGPAPHKDTVSCYGTEALEAWIANVKKKECKMTNMK